MSAFKSIVIKIKDETKYKDRSNSLHIDHDDQ